MPRDDDGLGVVQKSIQHRGGDGAVVVKDRGLLLEGLVGGQHDGALFAAPADDLEEEIGTVLVAGKIANLVQCQELRPQIGFGLAFEQAAFLRGRKVVDDADGVGEEHGRALLTGRVAQSGGEVGFSETDISQEHDVGLLLEELHPEEVLHRQAVDFLGPVAAELFQRFEDRKGEVTSMVELPHE